MSYQSAPSGAVTTEWERPGGSYHAHWDCFSGAAGDMMLAACVDASGNAPSLLSYIQFCLEQGLPELKGDFSLQVKRVWRSEMGSIAASYVTVHSRYNHSAAPVPSTSAFQQERTELLHAHDHGHGHAHLHSSSTVGQDTHDESQPFDKNDVDDTPHSHDHHPHAIAHESGPLRNLPQIRGMLRKASTEYIPEWVRDTAIKAFTELAQAEAMTHGADSPDAVHFHEVGAIDSIVDTIGTLLAMDCLGIKTVSCSPLPMGQGTVWTAHGLLPVPAPATLRLLVDMPTCPGPPGVTGELVTPTAAALLKVLTMSYKSKIPGRSPCYTIRCVGIGAGTKNFVKHPNVLRLIVGDDVVEHAREL